MPYINDRLTFEEYQAMARRTQNRDLAPDYQLEHATWGLAAETGEVLALHQKIRQGRHMDHNALVEEIGDVMWFVAELCDCYGLDMGAVALENIDKLKARYPDGFDAARSGYRG